jgi:hypothetical protein
MQSQSADEKSLNPMSNVIPPQRVSSEVGDRCGSRDQTEPFVHGGKEVFAQYLLRKKKKILN